MVVSGRARLGRRTKALVRSLHPGEIAVLSHPDLDRVAAQALLAARVKAVINAAPSVTGRYPAEGTDLLLEAGVPVLDSAGEAVFDLIPDGAPVRLEGDGVWVDGRLVARGRRVTLETLESDRAAHRARFQANFVAFLKNTVERADQEKDWLLGPLDVPPARVPIRGRHALIVVRGLDFRADLETLRAYIRDVRPVLIGVDGGADGLLEFGLRPDVVVGDMDSVGDEALRQARQIVVHAYPDGRAPGLERVRRLGLAADILRAPGTSEDVALHFAHDHGARLLVLVGSHSGFVDFMEKDRAGMASTLLTRMKVGHMLVDAKGVHQLYRTAFRPSYLLALTAAALVPAALVVLASPLMRAALSLVYWKVRLWLGW
ncbi:MAG: hypothetical protein IMW98_10585 [Firmicutes bacterium]|nr:hypothetical protein [Bacillota bacterium]